MVPHCSAFLISCNHSITRLISFTKTLQIRDQFFLYADPGDSHQWAMCALCNYAHKAQANFDELPPFMKNMVILEFRFVHYF